MPGATFIHPLSQVEPGAEFGEGVRIGPFCHIGPEVVLGDNVEVISHVSITGATTIGAGTRIFPQAILGGLPQNVRHKGGRTTLTIGSNCTIRESVTMHCGTDMSRGETTVGDNGYFLVGAHVAHDCVVGSNVTMANCATLGGHCEVGDRVTIGGLTGIHQFVRIGEGAFVTACSGVAGDVIPYGIAFGAPAALRGINVVGMQRSGMSRAELHTVRNAYRMVFDRTRPIAENLANASAEFAGSAPAMKIVDFLRSRDKRYFCVPALDGEDADGDQFGA
jgi:UDP-N-acetylglucosamine acyltransferase